MITPIRGRKLTAMAAASTVSTTALKDDNPDKGTETSRLKKLSFEILNFVER